jgi:ATP-dependent RNA helicase DDX49/DBP8
MMDQANALANHPHVIVATPGRLLDLMTNAHGQWSLSRIRFLVLDEADRLLAPSFAAELSAIIKELPVERQTLLFTATVTPSILALKDREPAPGKAKPFVHLAKQECVTITM